MTKATSMHAFPAVRTLADVEAIERTPLGERLDADSTYEVLRRAARNYGDRPALRFLAKGTPDEDAVVVTYAELLRRVTQTANLFAALGVGRDEVVSYVLPNLPETHDTIWGAEAAGIVTAINPFLKPGTIRDLLDAARARLLVTLAPTPGFDLFEKVAAIADEVASLRAVLCVDPSRYLGARARALPVATPGGKPILSFDTLRAEQPADRLRGGRRIRPERAAAPAHVEILDAMPVTAVGKIVKGPLRRWRANVSCGLRSRRRAVQDAHVEVYDDAARGLVARVSTAAPGAAPDVLGRFAIAYELVPPYATE
jgi:fatty-acyl-CoA synthase